MSTFFTIPGPGDARYRDHVAEMLARLPGQFRSKTDAPNNIERLLTVIGGSVQDLWQAMQQVLLLRAIESAMGAQLDVLGRIVKEPRNGLDDDTYRRRVRARIAVHRSRATFEDLITITKLVVLVEGALIRVVAEPIASVVIHLENAAVTDGVADTVLFSFLQAAVASGVRVILHSGSGDPTNWFTLDTSQDSQALDNSQFTDTRG
jgi:hypothetical protein